MDQVFLDLSQWANVGGQLLLEFAGQLVAAAALLHPFPEVNVVEMLRRIVKQSGIFTERAFHNLLYRFVFPFGAFGKIITRVHISLMMFVVMEFERLA